MSRLTSIDFCTDQEKIVLIAITSLAQSLTQPSVHYIRALGEITSRWYGPGGGPRGVHNPNPGSLAQTHDVRATPRWQVRKEYQ